MIKCYRIDFYSSFYLLFLLWGGVFVLYSFKFSDLLLGNSNFDVAAFSFLVPFLFFLSYFTVAIAFSNKGKTSRFRSVRVDISYIKKVSVRLSFFLIGIVIFEFVWFGYIPFIDMLVGAGRSHFDFGIPGVHGLVMSLGALLAFSWFIVYHATGRKRYLLFVFLIFLFFILVVTRKMIVVSVLEISAFCFFVRKNNSLLWKVVISCFVFVVLFGYVGDVRTGRELFLSLSRLNVDYPEVLPTGFGWIYIYITTPIANLFNAFSIVDEFSYDFNFMNGLLPSFIRGIFFDLDIDHFDNAWQISGAFNVATGFLSLYTSWGMFGVFVFVFFMGAGYFFVCRLATDEVFVFVFFVYIVIIFLMIFTNNFFNLNTVSQIFFACLFYGRLFKKHKRLEK